MVWLNQWIGWSGLTDRTISVLIRDYFIPLACASGCWGCNLRPRGRMPRPPSENRADPGHFLGICQPRGLVAEPGNIPRSPLHPLRVDCDILRADGLIVPVRPRGHSFRGRHRHLVGQPAGCTVIVSHGNIVVCGKGGWRTPLPQRHHCRRINRRGDRLFDYLSNAPH